jgi:hypothetical protein
MARSAIESANARLRPRLVPALLACASLAVSMPARAEAPKVAVLRTTAVEPELARLAAAVDPVVLARLGERGVDIAAHPAFDLQSVQLARDCVGETPVCLRMISEALGADVLIAASLDRAGGETILTVLYFDARKDEIRSAARQHGGSRIERGILDDVRDVLHELLATSASEPPPKPAPLSRQVLAAAQAATAAPAGSARTEPAAPPPADDAGVGLPVLPIVLMATGTALLGGGIALGLMAEDGQRDYARSKMDSRSEIDAAYARIETAETQAILANIGLAAGGAAILTGLALLIFDDVERAKSEELRVRASLGPSGVQLGVQGRSANISL